MGLYTHQAKATKLFGVEFRSKLEATWAYALADMRMHDKPLEWDYVDSPWHDFVLHCPWGKAYIEIKPAGKQFLCQALLRMPVGETLFVFQGEPTDVDEYWSSNVITCAKRCDEEDYFDVRCHLDICWLEKMALSVATPHWPVPVATPLSKHEMNYTLAQ